MIMTLLDYIPTWLLFVIVVGGSVVLTCGTLLFLYRVKVPPLDAAYNDLIGFFFSALGLLYAVILAFQIYHSLAGI